MEEYTIEVSNLSPRATEQDVYNFFAFCGDIERVEIIRSGDYSSTAYVTFKDPHALGTALLLSRARIFDQPVCISRWGHVDESSNFWSRYSPWRLDEDPTRTTNSEARQFNVTPREAASVAQEVMKKMIAKGYVLGKDALRKAKEYDQSHHVSGNAAANFSDLSSRYGFTNRMNAGVNTARSMNERYKVSGTSRTIASATARTAAAAASAMAKSSYFATGAMWLSDALTKASRAAADMANRENRH